MPTLPERLRELKQQNQHLSEKQISEKTGISQPTINRILNGKTTGASSKTLKALVQFFNNIVTETNDIITQPTTTAMQQPVTAIVPVFDWDDLRSNLKDLGKKNLNKYEYIQTLTKMEGEAFALILKDELEKFPEGTTLIFKLKIPFKNRDYVLVDSGQDISLKQFIIDGNARYLKSLVKEMDFSITRMIQTDIVVAVLVQAVVNYQG